jgi:hypothetical protein
MTSPSRFIPAALRHTVITLLVLWVCVLVADANSAQFKGDLVQALKHVDRLVITPPLFGDENTDPETTLFEIRGHERIMSLIALMEFKDDLQDNCLCDGTHRFQFFNGANYKFTLSYHHFVTLRGELGAPWIANVTLTEKSRDAVNAWFAQEGFEEIQKLWDTNMAQEARDKKYVADIASLFPPESRDWFPKRGRNLTVGTSELSHKLADLYPEKSELLLTCWRAFGKMTTWEHHQGLSLYDAPCTFLLQALDSVSADDIQTALSKLPPEDKDAWLGAMGYFCPIRKEAPHSKTTPNWLVRLARYYFENGPVREQRAVVREIGQLNAPEADIFLMEVGQLKLSSTNQVHQVTPASDASAMALFYLAQKNHPSAQAIIVEQLAHTPTGNSKLLLEIALAHYINQPLSVEHLSISHSLSFIGTEAWDLAKKQMSADAYTRLIDEAADSPDESVRYLAKNSGGRGKEPAAVSMKQPNFAGPALIEYCSAQLKAEKDEARRADILAWRGKAHIELGEYDFARADLRKSNLACSYEKAFCALALGRYGEVFYDINMNSFHVCEAEKARYQTLYACIQYLQAKWFTDPSSPTKDSPTEAPNRELVSFLKKYFELVGGTELQGVHTPYNEPLKTAIVQLAQEKLLESKLRETMKTPPAILLGNWVLAELALIHGKTTKAQSHLTICLETQAYTDPIFIMARLRQQALAERN